VHSVEVTMTIIVSVDEVLVTAYTFI
jgi:hypothetical protein